MLLLWLAIVLLSKIELLVVAEDLIIGKRYRLSQQHVETFKTEHGLPTGTNLTYEEISTNNTFAHEGKVYRLAGGTPPKLFTAGATYTHNGKAGNLPITRRIRQHVQHHGRETVTISTRVNGDIAAVMIAHHNGSVEELVSIVPGVLVPLPAEDYETNKSRHHDDDTDFRQYYHHTTTADVTTATNVSFDDDDDDGSPPGRTAAATACESYRRLELAVVYESTFCAHSGGSQETADEEVLTLVAMISSRFRQAYLCVRVELSHLEGYCNATVDPYKVYVDRKVSGCRSDGDDENNDNVVGLLHDFQDFWNTNRTHVRRDVAQLFSGTQLECNNGKCVVGCAKLSSTCVADRAYAVNWATFGRNSVVQRTTSLAHELGHANGANHYSANKGYIMDAIVVHGEAGFSINAINDMNRHFQQTSCVEETNDYSGMSAAAETPPPCKGPFYVLLRFSPLLLLLLYIPTKVYQKRKRSSNNNSSPPSPPSAGGRSPCRPAAIKSHSSSLSRIFC